MRSRQGTGEETPRSRTRSPALACPQRGLHVSPRTGRPANGPPFRHPPNGSKSQPTPVRLLGGSGKAGMMQAALTAAASPAPALCPSTFSSSPRAARLCPLPGELPDLLQGQGPSPSAKPLLTPTLPAVAPASGLARPPQNCHSVPVLTGLSTRLGAPRKQNPRGELSTAQQQPTCAHVSAELPEEGPEAVRLLVREKCAETETDFPAKPPGLWNAVHKSPVHPALAPH